MQELRWIIHDPSLVAELQPEELGAKILFLLRERMQKDSNLETLPLTNERLGLWPHYSAIAESWVRTPDHVRKAVELALTEAWAWLRAQGLLIPAERDWETLSRRARAFESEADFASFATARLLRGKSCTSSWRTECG